MTQKCVSMTYTSVWMTATGVSMTEKCVWMTEKCAPMTGKCIVATERYPDKSGRIVQNWCSDKIALNYCHNVGGGATESPTKRGIICL